MKKMKSIIKVLHEPELENPILIEGLPGIGNVGKLAVNLMIDELNAKKFAELYSPTFPDHVIIEKDGLLRPLRNEFYYWKKDDNFSLIFLTGDYQSQSVRGQYELSEDVINFVKKYNVKKIFALGGFATGEVVEESKVRVFGSASDSEMASFLTKNGVILEDKGVIVGITGLLIVLGKLKEIQGACLLGETSGSTLDANAAKAVVKMLLKLLNLEETDIDFSRLDQKVEEMKQAIEKKMEIDLFEEKDLELLKKKDKPSYIG